MFRKYTDKNILDGIRQQDDKALKYVYDCYFPMVKNHVLRNSGDHSDAGEVMQESIIVLYKQALTGELNLSTDLKGYFFGIVRMVWSSTLRQKQKFSELNTDVAEESPAGEEGDTAMLEKIIARAMNLMKDDCREVLLMFSAGKSYAEIARVLGLKSAEYARRKKYLCKDALMELIKKDREYRDHFE
ncbi:MAG: sigma-70 family RNA polymerase sigma factor [Bacteroidetes bacterium]|nr:sigma-70 family RNA polymerase sigma factor [Bacteroidota bacterium]